jgi:hypothetical protein
MIKPIKRSLMDFKEINNITINKRKFEFSESAAGSVNSTKIENNSVQISFEYILAKGGPFIANCVIPILPSKFGEMVCERENE